MVAHSWKISRPKGRKETLEFGFPGEKILAAPNWSNHFTTELARGDCLWGAYTLSRSVVKYPHIVISGFTITVFSVLVWNEILGNTEKSENCHVLKIFPGTLLALCCQINVRENANEMIHIEKFPSRGSKNFSNSFLSVLLRGDAGKMCLRGYRWCVNLLTRGYMCIGAEGGVLCYFIPATRVEPSRKGLLALAGGIRECCNKLREKIMMDVIGSGDGSVMASVHGHNGTRRNLELWKESPFCSNLI